MTLYMITMGNGYYNLLFSTREKAKAKIPHITSDIFSFTQDDFRITPIKVKGTPIYDIAYLVIGRGELEYDNGIAYSAIYISDVAYATVEDAKNNDIWKNHEANSTKINYTEVREINIE